MGILSYKGTDFLMDGKPYTVVSGAMHYFRIPREYWHDRLLKLKECGFNTVETYTCWNLHEPQEGIFDFSGMLDIAAYAREAQELGLNMILRPGPYICAEWEAGGLPAWLLSYPDMALRCHDARFLEKVRRYYTALFDLLRPMLATNGGNIIMVQIENEYGSYGDDKEYLAAVEKIYLDCGVDVLLYTSDGACNWMLSGGSLPNRLCVANFGSKPEENFADLKKFREGQPLMCGEYWCGWFDHWYEEHHVRDAEELAGLFRDMLKSGASLNFYMFHGGTNFGFMNGANHHDCYEPTVTSYDYNALLSEAGDLTPAYHAVRAINEEFFGKLPPLTVKNLPKKAYGKVRLTEKAGILEAAPYMSDKILSPVPRYQEEIGQAFGFTLYSTEVRTERDELPLIADTIHDRAVFYINGVRKGLYERDRRADQVSLALKRGECARVDILVENMGRINYGPEMPDHKGLAGVRFGQQKHFGWEMRRLEMSAGQLARIVYSPCSEGVADAAFLRGSFQVEGKPCDTFVRLDGFHNGFVAVNGFNLGRYYNDAGPQKTLYCPAPMLHEGENEIVVFETDGCEINEITLTDTPDLG